MNVWKRTIDTKREFEWAIHDIINEEAEYAGISNNEKKEALIMEVVEKYIKERE